jgi:hypothetical protein
VNGLDATVTTKVEWNNDPKDKVATSYRNAAFYKKVTVTVTRSSDSKKLSQMVTYVADTGTSTGVSDAEIDLTVTDIGSNTPVSGQDVTLSTGPSATPTPLTDTTDAAGSIIFPALTANPTSGATAYYNLSLTPPAGYTLLKDDDIAQTPNSTNAHIQLAPSQIFPSTMRIYKGSTITVALQDQGTGTTYAGNATVTLSTTLRGSPASQTLSYSGGPVSTTTFAGEKVIPAPSSLITGGYTASVSNGFYATAVTKTTVPNSYPSDLNSTFTLTGYPTGTMTATVTWAGNPVASCSNCVTLSGGPASITKTASTNASGVATFSDVPAGSGYTVTVVKGGQTGTATATQVAGATTNVPVAMPVGSVAVTVTSAGNPISGASISITGGNISGTLNAAGTTDATGKLTVANVPAGSGMTVTATKGSQTGSATGVSVTGGNTTNVSVTMPLGSIQVTVTWAGSPVANCTNCVTLSGGSLSGTVTGSTDGTGKVTFINVPGDSGYTVSATKNGQTGTTSGITVTGGSTTPVTVTLPVGTVSVHVTWAGSDVSGATVQLSGGNITGTISATTNSSGIATFSNNVPAGSGVTATATKNGQSGSTSGITVTGGSTTNVTVTMPVGSVTVTVTWASAPVSGATVQLSGGNISGTITAGTTTNGSGQVTIANVPTGTGVTATATKSSQTGTTSGQTVTASGPNNIAVAMPLGTFVVSVDQPSGTNAPGADVTLSGGPMGISVGPVTADSNGQVTFTNVPAGSGYTIAADRYGKSASSTNQSVSGGGTSNVSISLANYNKGNIKITIKRSGGSNCNNTSFNWTISGGPYSVVFTGTNSTNGSGVLGTFSNFPAGSGYTVNVVKASNSSHNATTSGVTVTNGSTTNVTLTLNTNTCP